MPERRYAVIGGGIIGAAVARRLLQLLPEAEVTVLEKQDRLATHQAAPAGDEPDGASWVSP